MGVSPQHQRKPRHGKSASLDMVYARELVRRAGRQTLRFGLPLNRSNHSTCCLSLAGVARVVSPHMHVCTSRHTASLFEQAVLNLWCVCAAGRRKEDAAENDGESTPRHASVQRRAGASVCERARASIVVDFFCFCRQNHGTGAEHTRDHTSSRTRQHARTRTRRRNWRACCGRRVSSRASLQR